MNYPKEWISNGETWEASSYTMICVLSKWVFCDGRCLKIPEANCEVGHNWQTHKAKYELELNRWKELLKMRSFYVEGSSNIKEWRCTHPVRILPWFAGNKLRRAFKVMLWFELHPKHKVSCWKLHPHTQIHKCTHILTGLTSALKKYYCGYKAGKCLQE